MMGKLTNPVLLKELKLRFRFFKSVSGMLAYLIAMSIFVIGFFYITTQLTGTGYFRPSESFYLFSMLSLIQMGMILFIAPGLTAGAISAEREKQTLNMLLTTTQSSWQIIIGKLLSSLAFLGLLLFASLPFYSLVFLFGGISPVQLLTVFFFYFVTMVAIGSIGIFFSTMTKRTITSMIATYSSSVFVAGFTLFFFFISIMVNQTMIEAGEIAPFTYFWLSINPGALVLSLLSGNLMTEFYTLAGIDIPIWVTYLLFYTVLSIVLLTISSSRLRANMKRG
nr:ABC transporter permease [Lysinibacillus odysseyi]